MPPETQIQYQFSFQDNERYTMVFFLGRNPEYNQSHNMAYQIRRRWARSLPISQSWATLPDSIYVNYLRNNELNYQHYCIYQFDTMKVIFIQ